jgi:hypothetical protein
LAVIVSIREDSNGAILGDEISKHGERVIGEHDEELRRNINTIKGSDRELNLSI